MDCFFLFFNMINSLSEHDCGTELLNVIKFIARFEKENMHMEHLRCVVELHIRVTHMSALCCRLKAHGKWTANTADSCR